MWSRGHCALPSVWRRLAPKSQTPSSVRSAVFLSPTAWTLNSVSAIYCFVYMAMGGAITSSNGRWRCASYHASRSTGCVLNGYQAPPWPSRTLPPRFPMNCACEVMPEPFSNMTAATRFKSNLVRKHRIWHTLKESVCLRLLLPSISSTLSYRTSALYVNKMTSHHGIFIFEASFYHLWRSS